MSQLSKFLRHANPNRIHFWCPGCEQMHGINTGADGWNWNGNVDKPTFNPSVLVTTTRFTAKGEADYEEWYADGCRPRQGVEFESEPVRCHSFVTDGRINFLDDCTHSLAGQTVDLPELPPRD